MNQIVLTAYDNWSLKRVLLKLGELSHHLILILDYYGFVECHVAGFRVLNCKFIDFTSSLHEPGAGRGHWARAAEQA